MRKQTLMALSLAASVALPFGFSAGHALAVTPDQRAEIAAAATVGGATMQATIARVLETNAAERPLAAVLQELSATLVQLGASEEIQAELAVALVAAARQVAASGGLPGVTPDAAAEAAAEQVLVDAQASPTLIAAIVSHATTRAAADGLGGQGSMVLAAFTLASGSPLIAQENRAGIQNALVQGGSETDLAGDSGGGSGGGAGGGGAGTGGGPNLGGMNLVNVIAGATGGNAGFASQDTTGRGEPISPN